jgi:hypothetical protein
MWSGLQIENRAGKPIVIGKNRITPFYQSVGLNMPQINGGMLWNRPVSVLAVNADGEESVIPVVDVTRRIQIVIFGSGLFILMLTWLLSRVLQRESSEQDA